MKRLNDAFHGLSVLTAILLTAGSAAYAVPKVWNGLGADNLASNPDNWIGAAAPQQGDDIVLDGTSHKNMTWNLTNRVVGSWTQHAYAGTVTVATVYHSAGFTNFMISGHCIISNGVWTHPANTTAEANRLRVSVGGNLVIGPAGGVDVTGKGYNATGYRGPGGGASGGYGGRARIPWNVEQAGHCYGSITAPTNIGSAGSTSGGGAIHFSVCGAISNRGLIRADGVASAHYNGSGGGIYVVAGTIAGDGVIQADGGAGGTVNGGGGGRIALVATNAGADFSAYTGPVNARQGGTQAGPGTVYRETASDGAGRGTVWINGIGGSGLHYTEINPNVTETVLATVLIVSNAHLAVTQNHALEVSGIWSNAALFTGQAGSQVVFSDRYTPTSTLYGATTFMGLTCTNDGTVLLFPPNITQSVAAGGSLNLRGSATKTNLLLRSHTLGQPWRLNVHGAAAQSVWHIDVQDSDASPATQVTAFFSRDGGNNTNWTFSDVAPGIINLWTGGESTLWSIGGNWSSGRCPVPEDSIRIPPSGNDPVIDGMGRIAANLRIEPGAVLRLNGYHLTVTGDATIAGALTCAGSETVTFQGDLDFTGGAFTPAVSRVVLAGNRPQTVVLDGRTFHKVIVVNTNTVAFTDGLMAYELLSEPPSDEQRSLVFAADTTVTLDFLTLLSAPGTTNITLRSANDGQAWRMAVASGHSLRGLDVKDSHADGGQRLYASGSRNAGGNSNWDFDQNWVEWTGAAGNGLFTDAANWWPATIPDGEAWVRVANALPVTIATPVTVSNLTIGGATPAALVTVNAALTVRGDLFVQTNGTLSLNRPSAVSNDVTLLAGGTLTHNANTTTEANKLNLTVAGNMGVCSDARIEVSGRGYSTGNGPGGTGGVVGGSYGGRGTAASRPCYGSIIAPTHLGSGGGYGAGGGAIQLAVSGAFRNDGLIRAEGAASIYPSGSGGSVWITAGTMRGVGSISVNGPTGAGGGRVALMVTHAGADLEDMTGPVTAYGGGGSYGAGGAGTIYRQSAAQGSGRGVVLVAGFTSGTTDVPPSPPNVWNETRYAVFRVALSARLRLTDDYTVGDIWLDSAASVLDLGLNTLTIKTAPHALGPGAVWNWGQIRWWSGSMLVIR